jgi:5-methylcytosine-specific restriction endonuclease McrA
MKYTDKLQDPRWFSRREEIIKRDNYECQRCFNSKSESVLNVHHLRYFPGHEPWEYEDDDLITICQPCHKAVWISKSTSEEINNPWLVYERMKKLIPKNIPPRRYETAVLKLSNKLSL